MKLLAANWRQFSIQNYYYMPAIYVATFEWNCLFDLLDFRLILAVPQPNDFRANHKRSREGERDLLHTTLNNTWPNIMRFDGAGNSVSQFIRGQNDLCQIHINMPSIIAVPYGTKHLRLIRMLSNPFGVLFGKIQTMSRRFIAKIICQHWYPACICRNQYGLVLRIPFEA